MASRAQIERVKLLLADEGLNPSHVAYLARSKAGRNTDRELANYVLHMVGRSPLPPDLRVIDGAAVSEPAAPLHPPEGAK